MYAFHCKLKRPATQIKKQTKRKLQLVTIAKWPPHRSRGRASSLGFTSASPCLRVVFCTCPGIDGSPGLGLCHKGCSVPEGEAKPCKAPVGASSCVRVSRWKVALSHVVECHPLPGCHADMNISLFLLFFYFFFPSWIFLNNNYKKGFVLPGARDLLPLIWFFGGGRTGRDLLMVGEKGKKKEFKKDKTRGNQKWV